MFSPPRHRGGDGLPCWQDRGGCPAAKGMPRRVSVCATDPTLRCSGVLPWRFSHPAIVRSLVAGQQSTRLRLEYECQLCPFALLGQMGSFGP